MSVYRPAVDVRGRGRAVAAVAAVLAVLVMHGLSCMAGSAHTAGIPVIGEASATHRVSAVGPHDCPGCRHHADMPVGQLQDVAFGVPTTWAGGAEHPGEHGGVPCIATLTGLGLLALLAAAAATAGLPVPAADGRWLRLRRRPPTALLRPSLCRLCVLRT
jgi:hypothetical protein